MTKLILPEHIRYNSSTGVSVNLRRPNREDLNCINGVIAAAITSWNLPQRVKRLSLPLYRYLENDVEQMQFLIAGTVESGIVGLAALEEVDAKQCPDGGRSWLLHGLYVDPGYHHQGVGTQLVDAAEVVAVAHGGGGLLVRAQGEAQLYFENRGFAKLPVENISRDYAYRYWKPIQSGGHKTKPSLP